MWVGETGRSTTTKKAVIIIYEIFPQLFSTKNDSNINDVLLFITELFLTNVITKGLPHTR